VRLVAGGETVLITDRDRVVAELVPPTMGRALTGSDAVLAAAVRQGWLPPPLVGRNDEVPRQPLVPFARIAEDLDRDRADS